MKYILHADDFGLDKDTVESTIECFEKGYINSASIIANGSATDLAIQYAKTHPNYSFGIHLNYIDGFAPLSEASKIESLVDSDGKFFDTHVLLKLMLLMRLKYDHIKKETNAQISKIVDSGIKVSHIDSHGNIHKLPLFQDVLVDVISTFGINKVRLTQNIFLSESKEKTILKLLNSYFNILMSKRFHSTNYLYMPAHNFDVNWSNNIIKKMQYLPKETTLEIAVHPGKKEHYRTFEYNDIATFAINIPKEHNMITWNDII
ncbi:MAG: ChbG/HpnK family deacetylase [Bacteroidales bacterium]